MNKSNIKGFIVGVTFSFSIMGILVLSGVYKIERDYSHRIGNNDRIPSFNR